MATNIYGNGLNSTAGANTVVHYYDRAGIKAANAVNVYGQFVSRKDMPTKMGKTFKISKFLHMYDRALNDAEFATKGFMTSRTADEVSAALTNASLSEGAGAVNKRSLQKVTVETTLARYGEMIDYTDEVDLFSEDYIQVKYREELGELANSRMEDLIQLDMLGTPTKMYSGIGVSLNTVGDGIASDGSEDGDWRVSFDLIRKAVRKLTRNRAKKNTTIVTGSTKIDTKVVAKSYYGIIDADIKTDLENLTRGSSYEKEFVFQPVEKYGDAAKLAEGEVGAMYQVRFIEAERAVNYAGKGASVPGNYNGSLAYTADAASLVFRNLGSSAVDITGVIATNPYGTSVAAGAVVTATTAAHATALDAVVGLTRDIGKFDVHTILFPTEGSFATVGLKGQGKIKFNSKDPASVENVNPYGTTGFFSYNFFYSGIILEPERLLAVYCGVSK